MRAQSLKSEIEAFAERLPRTLELWRLAAEGKLTPPIVAAYLFNLSHVVSFTTPHLARARQRASDLGRTELARFFAAKSEEEAGHERWALADLREIECRFGVAVPRRPAANIVRLIAKLERHIDENPVSYLGYMIFTEYFTVLLGPAWMRALTQHCGVPNSALSVVEHHVELDREHAARGFRVLSALSDQPGDALAVLEVVRGTMALLEAFYDELAALTQAPSYAA